MNAPDRQTRNRPPRFFWQAVLIVLPVVGLTVLGLISLQQDRALAGEQAKDSAALVAAQWTDLVGRQLERAFLDYDTTRSELKADWETSLGFRAWAAGTDVAAVRQHIANWQARHPGIPLPDQPDARLALPVRDDPRFAFDEPVIGCPPAWLIELAPEQRQFWYAAQVALASGQTNEAMQQLQSLADNSTVEDLRANAQFLKSCLEAEQASAAEAVKLFRELQDRFDQVPSETSFPLGQLAWQHAMRRLPSGSGFDTTEVKALVHVTESWPATPLLGLMLAELTRLARPDSTEDASRLEILRRLLNARQQTARVVADLARLQPWDQAPGTMFWMTSDNRSYLAVIHPAGPTGDETNPSSAVGPVSVLVYPGGVVSAALAECATEAATMIPRYSRLVVRLGDRDMEPGQTGGADAAVAGLPLLAERAATLEALPRPEGSPPPSFQVRMFLADAPLLYAQQRQRAWLFGGLVLAAAGTALIGLAAAHRAFQRQLRLSEMKSSFVSSVSHELRAPIASVRLLAESLDRGTVTDETRRREYFRLMGQECRRLSALIENVLDFSRIDQGRKPYEFEPTDLPALVAQTVRLLEPYAAERQVSLKLLPPSAFDLQPSLDARAIQQALVNLIDNAVKHSPPGASVEIALEVHPAACGLRLCVSDHGPGIPPAEHARIFEPFYRRGSELRRETTGFGIGLSIVKHVVEAHGGRVWVESEVGRGSRFVVELPVRDTPPQPTP
jgi:signal transduction histidine kinase